MAFHKVCHARWRLEAIVYKSQKQYQICRVRNNGSWFVNHESIFIFHEPNFIEIDQNHESKVNQIDKNIQ
jgi:hypothetical protein